MNPYDNKWAGCKFPVKDWIDPCEHFGGSSTTWINPSESSIDMDAVLLAFDHAIRAEKEFAIVYVAKLTYPDTSFWTYQVCYRRNNPDWHKGARGIPESISLLAYFPSDHF